MARANVFSGGWACGWSRQRDMLLFSMRQVNSQVARQKDFLLSYGPAKSQC